MTDAAMSRPATRTPWHLWLVGGLGFLWNLGGASDYLLTQLRLPFYMAEMTADQIAFMDSFPALLTAVWAIGVWGALLGSVLLLFRRRWAFHAFAAGFAGFLVSLVWNLSRGVLEVMGGPMILWFSAAVFVIFLFELWYSRMMAKRGVLR